LTRKPRHPSQVLGRRRKNLSESERRDLHCGIQNLRILHGQSERARLGELTSLPGVQIKYETPAKPGIIACGGLSTEAVGEILERITGVAP